MFDVKTYMTVMRAVMNITSKLVAHGVDSSGLNSAIKTRKADAM